MARRPAIRKSDLSAAFASALAVGLRPRSTRFHPEGGFTLEFEADQQAQEDAVTDELARLEARHGQG